jgi:hypothetical protein
VEGVLLGAFYRAGAACRAVGREIKGDGQSCSSKASVSSVSGGKRRRVDDALVQNRRGDNDASLPVCKRQRGG